MCLNGISHRVFECRVESILKFDRAAHEDAADFGDDPDTPPTRPQYRAYAARAGIEPTKLPSPFAARSSLSRSLGVCLFRAPMIAGA